MKRLASLRVLLAAISVLAFPRPSLAEPRPLWRVSPAHHDYTTPWSSYLFFDRNQCQAVVDDIETALRMYGLAALHSQQAGVDGSWETLQYFFGVARELGCEQAALETYAVNAVAMMDRSNIDSSEWNEYYPSHVLLPLWTAAAANTSILQFLTPSVRGGLGSKWSKETRIGSQLVGAYSCEKAILYADPGQRPFDFGASLIHELSHWRLDQSSSLYAKWVNHGRQPSPTEIRSYYESLPFHVSPDSGLPPLPWSMFPKAQEENFFDPRDTILFDEANAVAAGAFYQFKLRYSHPGEFQIERDLSYVTPNGPLERLWEWNSTLFSDFENLMSNSVFSSYKDRKSWGPPIRELFKRVYQGYFTKAPESPRAYDLPSREKLSEEQNAFLPYVGNGFSDASPLYLCHAYEESKGRGFAEFDDFRQSGDRFSKKRYDCSFSLDLIEKPFHESSLSSVACGRFNHALRSGDVPDYVGYQIARRPGEKGVKGGEKGVKGDFAFVHPCLRLNEEP